MSSPDLPNATAPETTGPGAVLFRGYRVTADGTIYQRRQPDRVLRPKLASNGYLRINLWRDNHLKTYFVHTIVAACFLGPKPAGLEVNHKDGDKLNNAASNLEYVTRSENERHAIHVLDRGCRRGENHRLAILTEDKVRAIRAVHRNEQLTYKELGQRFGISGSHARLVALRKTWAWLPDSPAGAA